MDLGIAGRSAIVCASSKGLGRACAMELARAGCRVIVNARSGAVLKATAAAIRAAAVAEVIEVSGDVGKPEVRGQRRMGVALARADNIDEARRRSRQVAAIGLFSIDDATKLTRAGTSGFTTDKPAQAVLDFERNGVVQGAIEGANVNPIQEMTKLIAVTRNFDGVAAEVSQTESSFQDAIKTLGGAA